MCFICHRSYLLCCLFSTVILLCSLCDASKVPVGTTNPIVVSVTLHDGHYRLHPGIAQKWVAKANFTDSTFIDGWNYVEVESDGTSPDAVQAYAAGYVEGASSRSVIYNGWRNLQEGYCKLKGPNLCRDVYRFIRKNIKWTKAMIKQKSLHSPIWHHVNLVLSQLVGLSAGYNKVSKFPIPLDDFLLMNMFGDLGDLENALASSYRKIRPDALVNSSHILDDGHCSAIIKVLPGNHDLLAAHVTWHRLESMLRSQKKYILPYRFTPTSQSNSQDNADIVPGHVSTFSSYPGLLHSGDDYYILSSGLLTMETTIGNFNPQLWAKVKPVGELQEWIRVLLSNRLSSTGKQWMNLFSKYNSGTYNNQWMVVDYKRFKPGKPIRKDTLWVLEQMPGKITTGDQSHVLRSQTYWPSYNAPFYKDIFNISKRQTQVDQHGDFFTYDHAPRANIFKRDHSKVKDLDSLLRLMRYNDFKNDPLAACDCDPPYSAENAISARGDLDLINGTYPFDYLKHRNHIATDVKMTSSNLFFKMKFQAIVGPTNDQQPTFRWSESDFEKSVSHFGHPDVWNFSLVEHKWIW